MHYILIVMWMGVYSGTSGKAAIAVEFNDKQSCQIAAKGIQEQNRDNSIATILCAPKG